MKRTLDHYTVETGDVRSSPLSEVGLATLAELRVGLRHALPSADPVHLTGFGWSLVAREEADALEAALYPPGMGYPGPPAVVMRVEHRDGKPPLLTAALSGVMLAPDPERAALEAGNLERCVAWAWLTSARGSR